MFSLLRLFLSLCQLQRGPQDLPATPALLRQTILLCFFSGVLVFSVSLSLPDALLRASVSLAVSLLLWPIVLHASGRQHRLLQTLTAVLGCAALMNFLLWPLLWLLDSLGEKAALLPLLALGLALWSLVVNGHILRHTMDWPLPRSIALAVLLFALRFGIYQLVFGFA